MKNPLEANLLPNPQRFQRLPGDALHKKIRRQRLVPGEKPAGTYRISVSVSGTTLYAADDIGFLYAEQTLQQIDALSPEARPCLEIEDWPDFPVRGFYHDVTRGKVPTLATLLELAETCARYKLNHLQLYIEHTFAFKNHPEIWRGADPLTADEILAIDARCAELHIDLVPSFSTFGHCYPWIHDKFPELNELPRDVSGDPFTWWDRQRHYTLDCRNPRSLRLIREIIREVRPLFRSRYFNICADEPFDLGTGRNQAEAERVGKGRLYMDFLKAIMREVKQVHAVPLFWGDVIGSYPELLDEIPTDAIALDWDYSATLIYTKAEMMAKAGRKFFVCPGISGWNNWLPDYLTAYRNITRFARIGRRWGAVGLLNTDWGDFGHIHTLGPSLPGLVLGACASWNPHALDRRQFNAAVSRGVLGDAGGKLMDLLEEAVSARRASWQVVCLAHEPRSKNIPDTHFDAETGLPSALFTYSSRTHLRALKRIREIRRKALPRIARLPSRLIAEEIRTGLLGLECMEEYFLVRLARAAGRTKCPVSPTRAATRLRELSRRLEDVWMQRNKRSEFERIGVVLKAAAVSISNELSINRN